MGDVGIAVSQKGKEVQTTADRNLLFSSAFQTLKIFNVYSVSTTIPSSGINTITINHNLGYIAPYRVIYNGSTTRGQGTSYPGIVDGDGLGIFDFDRQYADKFELNIDGNFDTITSSVGDTVYFTVYIFLDDFTAVTEKNVNSDLTTSTEDEDYGFRVSKDGVDVKTGADIDMVTTSSTYTNIIHKKGTSATSAVSHNLGYVPPMFGYFKDSGASYIYRTQVSADSSNINFVITAGETAHYVIFKQKNA